MKVISEHHNTILKRREVVAAIESETNPGFAGAKTAVANHWKAPEERVVVSAVHSQFGSHIFLIHAIVYDNVDMLQTIERKPKAKKGAQ